jgi:3-hydroxymyristoyl/3-hydroxydecanoyl-(acyl carrier protein) dehydratases
MRFLLVDTIVEWRPGQRAVGLKNVAASEDFFDDHFPLKPIMPGVLIIEGMAQLSGLLLEETMKQKGAKLKALMSMVEKAKFRKPVYPGEQLVYKCEIDQINDFGGKISALATVNDSLRAECSLLFSFHSFGNLAQDEKREAVLKVWLANAKQ